MPEVEVSVWRRSLEEKTDTWRIQALVSAVIQLFIGVAATLLATPISEATGWSQLTVGVAAVTFVFLTIALNVGILFWYHSVTRIRETINIARSLEAGFQQIQDQDNIITPTNGEFRVISVPKLKAPEPVCDDWNTYIRTQMNGPEFNCSNCFGYSFLFAVSADEIVNNHKYVQYLLSMSGSRVNKILVLHRPSDPESLNIFREICAFANIRVSIIDVRQWRAMRSRLIESGPQAQRKLRRSVFQMVENHFEIWSSADLVEPPLTRGGGFVEPLFPSTYWVARWLKTEEEAVFSGVRERLTSPDANIEAVHSGTDLNHHERSIIQASCALAALIKARSENDALQIVDGDSEAIFKRTLPQPISDFLANITTSDFRPS